MKVVLRRLQEEDAYTSYRWRNDSEVFKYTGHRYTETITLECELEWIKKAIANRNEYRYAILVDGHYVGNTYLTGISDGKAWFHIFIGDRSYWGRGVAKEASKQIIDYGFNKLDLNSILLTAHPENLAAISIYEKLGFERNDMVNGRVVMELKNKTTKRKHMNKLLMLGTSYASCDMVRYAKSKGYHTIVTDYLEPEKSIAKKIADEYWMINTSDLDALEKKCREEGVNAVICGISEFNLEMTMALCERLGLPCYCTPEAWHYSRDKADFKKVCKQLGAPVPEDFQISDALTEEELDSIKFPVMVKPVDMSGNRGISYCYDKEDVVKAYKYARSLSKNNKIIVERMLHGEEWWAGYALAEGEISLMSLNGMYAQPGEPKNCYTLTTTVSDHVEQFINEINPKIIEVLKAVGCREGFAWVQVMLDEDGHFYIIEMGYRLTGEEIFVPLRKLIGFDTIAWLVDYAMGKKHRVSELPASQSKAFQRCTCAMELWTNREGIISEIIGWDKVASHPSIEAETLHTIGSKLDKYRPFGNVLFTCDTIEEMCDLIDLVNKEVSVLDEDCVDMIIKYTDFDYLKKVYERGLNGL